MAKKRKITIKSVLKFIFGALVFLTLPTLLLFGFLYLKYNEELPQGSIGSEADALAEQMLLALNNEAYQATDYIEWTFKGRHHYKWYKTKNKAQVYWQNYRVDLNLDNPELSKVLESEKELENDSNRWIELRDKALGYFNNDSFWLVAPYKVFDSGVERRLIKIDDNEDALLVTYTSGGSTPGDSYLWILDENKKPKSFKMWVSILPIDGLEASWDDWTMTESGAILPTFHELLILDLDIKNLKTE